MWKGREIHQLSEGDYIYSEDMRLLQLRDGSTQVVALSFINFLTLNISKSFVKVAGVKRVLGGENGLKESLEGRKHRPC